MHGVAASVTDTMDPLYDPEFDPSVPLMRYCKTDHLIPAWICKWYGTVAYDLNRRPPKVRSDAPNAEFMVKMRTKSWDDTSRPTGKGNLVTVRFIPGQCCPVPGCQVGPDTGYPVHQQTHQLTPGTVGIHWVNTHAQEAYAAFCRKCSFVSLMDSPMKSHLKSEHSIDYYSKVPGADGAKATKGQVANIVDSRKLQSTHVIVHKIVVSLGQKYGGIKRANNYVSPNGLGISLPNVETEPAEVTSVEYPHWAKDPIWSPSAR